MGGCGVVQYGGQPNETRTTGERLRCLLKRCSLHFSFLISPLLKLTGLGTRFKLIQHLQHLRRPSEREILAYCERAREVRRSISDPAFFVCPPSLRLLLRG